MKFIFCCESYYPSIGGVQEVVRQIAERLVLKGHQVIVATGKSNKRNIREFINGVEVLSFSISGNMVKGIKGSFLNYQQFILTEKCDAIMVKAAQQWSFDALIPVLPMIKTRKVFIPCGFSNYYQAGYKHYYKQMSEWIHDFDVLIFYSKCYQDINFAIENGHRSIKLLTNGADEREFDGRPSHDFRRKFAISESEHLLLTVGSLNGAKGHWEVAKSFHLARLDRPATLILNANLPLRTVKGKIWQFFKETAKGRMPLSIMIDKINMTDFPLKRIILTDLPRVDLVNAFKASDLFVFASHIEYSPLVLFEAIAAGTPFLSVPAGNAEEISLLTGGGVICPCPKSKAGMLCPDPKALAQEMTFLLSDSARLKLLGLTGRQSFIEKGLTWASIVDQYEHILCGN